MFRNDKFRKMLFAIDQDKKKGLNPQPPANNPLAPMQQPSNPMMPKPNPAQGSVPKLIPPSSIVSPTAVPGLPQLSKLPKFGKMRNSLKGQFKVK